MNIAIFGGGIGGLTVAHELSKLKHNIHIYEKKDQLGGLARTIRDDYSCVTETSWRVIFGFYYNIFRLITEFNPDKRILTKYKHLNISDKSMTFKEKLIILYNVLYGVCSSDKRLTDLDAISWSQSLNNISNTNVVRQTAPWLGLHRDCASYNSVIRIAIEQQMLPAYCNSSYGDYVTTKPTSEAIFDPWKQYLENNKVQIHLNSELISVKIKDNKIQTAYVHNHKTNRKHKIKADYYVFSMPIEVLANLVTITPELQLGSLKQVQRLRNHNLHIQVSIQIYFDKSISFGDRNAFLLVESPWDLIVLMYDQIYQESDLCRKIPNVKGGWSVVACTHLYPGHFIKKPLIYCSYEEIKTEIWYQIMESTKLRQLVKQYNNFELSSDRILYISPLWPTYEYIDGKLVTQEPKFTNNAGSLKLRPNIRTHIDNLFISTAYAKNGFDIYSMESACVSGIYAANLIDNRVCKPIVVSRPLLFAPFRFLDSILYYFELPNILPVLIVLMIIGILFVGIKMY